MGGLGRQIVVQSLRMSRYIFCTNVFVYELTSLFISGSMERRLHILKFNGDRKDYVLAYFVYDFQNIQLTIASFCIDKIVSLCMIE